jgi:S-adenosylmethionine synthetase
MKKDFIFTSESVTEGHPDKLCDQISDAIVDRFLELDHCSRVIAECAVFTNIVFLAIRYKSSALIDFPDVARKVIHLIGYHQPEFNARTCSIVTGPKEWPFEEHCTFNEKLLSDDEINAIPVQNQVTVFGFACNQTAALLPLPIWLAHKLTRALSAARLKTILPYLAPDGKSQVAVEYKNGRPNRIHSITLIASQNEPPESGGPEFKRLQQELQEAVIDPAFIDEKIRPDRNTRIFLNPNGPFIVGGPSIHSGLTGRKNAIDTYGEYGRQSGSLSGKDPMRIDRTGSYAARYAAKNVVAAGLADECEVQLSYSIGLAGPVSIQVETFGSGRIPDDKIAKRIRQAIDFRLAGIIKNFNLRHLPSMHKGGFYRKLAVYGQVGRMDIGLPWELTDKAAQLKG